MKTQHRYKCLAMPLIAGKAQTYSSKYGDYTPVPGEQLRPDFYSKAELREKALEPHFPLLYQQGEGTEKPLRIRDNHFAFYDGRRKPDVPFVFCIDTSQKAGAHSSRMVIQVWQFDGRHYFLVDVFAAVCDYETMLSNLKPMLRRYPPYRIVIEDTSTGSALISQARRLFDCEIFAVRPKGSKASRINRHFDIIRRRLIELPHRAEWVADWIKEVIDFPNGRYDDHVDTLSMALDHFRDHPLPAQPHIARPGSAVMVNRFGYRQSIEGGMTGPPGLVARPTFGRPPFQNTDGGRHEVRQTAVTNDAPIAFCATADGVVRVKPK